MRKAEALAHWRNLPENQNPLAVMVPVPYKTVGSKYGTCGIRIDGTPEFIDAVLSRLKPLLDGENQITRLELTRQPVKPVGDKRPLNAVANAEVCYVRLHMRGQEGAIAAGVFRQHEEETKRYAELLGVNADD